MTETDNQPVSVCNSAPFVAQEYATAHGPAWCAIHPGSGIVVATTTQEAASHAADAMNAAYRLGAQEKWCETVPVEYADVASELMGATEDASCGLDALASTHLDCAAAALELLRGGAPQMWRRRTGDELLYDSEQLIVALRVCKRDGRDTTFDGKSQYRWSIESVVVRCDEDYFAIEDSSGEPWGWSWEDVEYWMKADVLAARIPRPFVLGPDALGAPVTLEDYEERGGG